LLRPLEIPFHSAFPRAFPDTRGKEVHRPGMEQSRSNAGSLLLPSRGGQARKILPSTTFRRSGLAGATFAYHPDGAAVRPARRAPERHAVASQTLSRTTRARNHSQTGRQSTFEVSGNGPRKAQGSATSRSARWKSLNAVGAQLPMLRPAKPVQPLCTHPQHLTRAWSLPSPPEGLDFF
jgi:hypothetical protein